MYIKGMVLLVLRINNPQHCMVHCVAYLVCLVRVNTSPGTSLSTVSRLYDITHEKQSNIWKPILLTHHQLTSLVPRPLPDFISQPWRKIGRRPGTITTSRTGNGGLDSYVMWTRFHNDGNVPTQYAASTASNRTMKAFCQQLRTLQVPSR